jgi:hypothetical protein
MVTDTFASTVVVTIPVLMVSATVELRSLADAVTQRTVQWQKDYVLRSFDFVKLLAWSRRQTGLTRISALIGAVSKVPLPRLSIWVWLPLSWLIALALSAIAEVYSLLYLAGVHKHSAPAQLSIIAIMALVVLLIITPAAQTLVIAPWAGIHQYVEKARKLDLDPQMLEAVADTIPALVELKLISAESGKEMTEKVRSHPATASSAKRIDSYQQVRWRSYANTGLRSPSRRPPRWLLQRHTAPEVTYWDSEINEIDRRGYHSR